MLTSRYPVLAILLLAAGLRVAGIHFGLPLRFHPDEPALVRLCRTMLRTGDLNPHFFHWPALHVYLVAGVNWLGKRAGFVDSLADFFLAARFLSAALGTATVALSMCIANRIWRDRVVTLLTGVFIATAMLHVLCSHYATIDVAATFWLTLVGWLIAVYRSREQPSRRLYFATGVACGLAAASKYNTGLIVPVAMAWSVLWSRERDARPILFAPALIASGAGIAFLLTNPFSVLDAKGFYSGLMELLAHYEDPIAHPRNHGDANLFFNLYTLAAGEYGFLSLSTAVLGFGVLVARERRWDLFALASFPLLTFLHLSSQKANFARNLVPLIPFLAVASAHGTVFLVQLILPAKHRRELLVLGVGLLACAPALYNVVHFDALLLARDTREQASEWLAEHLDEGSRIALEREDWANPRLPPGTHARAYVLADHPVAFYRKKGFDYILTNSISYRAYFEYPDRVPARLRAYKRLQQQLVSEARLCVEFAGPQAHVPPNDELPNPHIRIFRLHGPCPSDS